MTDKNIQDHINPYQIEELMLAAEIQTTTYWGKTTVVTAKFTNGFVITESSSCVSPDNYSEEYGETICLGRIKNKLWELEGYLLQQRLYEQSLQLTENVSLESLEEFEGDLEL